MHGLHVHLGQVVAELNRARTELETEGRATQLGKLCATPFGVDIVGITEFVALIGALVGGAPRADVPPSIINSICLCHVAACGVILQMTSANCMYPIHSHAS